MFINMFNDFHELKGSEGEFEIGPLIIYFRYVLKVKESGGTQLLNRILPYRMN